MSIISDIARASRPKQWAKNAACIAPLVFSGQLFDGVALLRGFAGVLAFSALASGVYVFNDIFDRERDKAHPRKRFRPIAAGRLSVRFAWGLSAVWTVAAFAVAYALGLRFVGVLAVYYASNLLYSMWLKRHALADVMLIALGFVFRIQSGIEAVHAPQSEWILICIFFLTLYLGTAKRMAEFQAEERDVANRRPSLEQYTSSSLSSMMDISASVAIVSYSLFAILGRGGDASFLVTVPFVVYGIMRYNHLVRVYGSGEEPEDILIRDKQILIVVLLWVATSALIIYGKARFFPAVSP